MTSSRPSPSPFASGLKQEEVPIGASFSRTLRAFASEQQTELPRARPLPATLITKSRPLPVAGPLSRGLEKAASGKPEQPEKSHAAAKPSAKPSFDRKLARPRSQPLLAQVWTWLKKQQVLTAKKQLRVTDTVSLGEKRFVAILHTDGQKFLIGGGASGVSLLAELDNDVEFDSKTVFENEQTSQLLQPIACAGGGSR